MPEKDNTIWKSQREICTWKIWKKLRYRYFCLRLSCNARTPWTAISYSRKIFILMNAWKENNMRKSVLVHLLLVQSLNDPWKSLYFFCNYNFSFWYLNIYTFYLSTYEPALPHCGSSVNKKTHPCYFTPYDSFDSISFQNIL